MDQNKLAKELAAILPDRQNLSTAPASLNAGTDTVQKDREQRLQQAAASIKAKCEAKELARLKLVEERKLKREMEAKNRIEQAIINAGGDPATIKASTERQAVAIVEQQKRIETIEAIEAQTVSPLSIQNITAKAKAAGLEPSAELYNRALQLQGTSRPEIAKLLTSLNINLSIQLTKHDTANLLACLLTCNDSQLDALYNNKKTPIAIKAVIKRIKEDAKLGNIDTIEKLWDRIFGKGQMALSLPEQQQLQTGIIPNMPVSREAYVIIRDTLIK